MLSYVLNITFSFVHLINIVVCTLLYVHVYQGLLTGTCAPWTHILSMCKHNLRQTLCKIRAA